MQRRGPLVALRRVASRRISDDACLQPAYPDRDYGYGRQALTRRHCCPVRMAGGEGQQDMSRGAVDTPRPACRSRT